MKTIILNASPRRNWNTAQLLKSAAKGAESVGAEVEYVDLYDMTFTGCHACMACKRKGAEPRHCYWKDDLSPLLDRIFNADALIIGSPIYYSDTTSQFHALMERLFFINSSYGYNFEEFAGKVNVGVFYTMNAAEDYYHGEMEQKLKEQISRLQSLNGKMMILSSFDTLQVKDYSKYEMEMWDESKKQQRHDTHFPKDLEKAYQIGAMLSRQD